jgi:hypothetical protein
MKIITLQVMFQAISTIALTVGMAYTALQLRAWRATQYVANFTKLVELQLQLRKMVVDDPSLAPVGLALPTDNPEETRGFFYNLMQLSLFEIAWFSRQEGQLPDDYFASWADQISEISTRPAFQAMWHSDRAKILHDGFRQYMEHLMSDERISVGRAGRLTPPDDLSRSHEPRGSHANI